MEYSGKLYGKVGGKYFDTGYTAADWDKKVVKRVTERTAYVPVEIIYDESRESVGFLYCVTAPVKGDIIMIGDSSLRVLARSFGFKPNSNQQEAFAVVVTDTGE